MKVGKTLKKSSQVSSVFFAYFPSDRSVIMMLWSFPAMGHEEKSAKALYSHLLEIVPGESIKTPGV